MFTPLPTLLLRFPDPNSYKMGPTNISMRRHQEVVFLPLGETRSCWPTFSPTSPPPRLNEAQYPNPPGFLVVSVQIQFQLACGSLRPLFYFPPATSYSVDRDASAKLYISEFTAPPGRFLTDVACSSRREPFLDFPSRPISPSEPAPHPAAN